MYCEICTMISESFRNNEAEDDAKFELGSIAEIRHRAETCPSCRQILHFHHEEAAVDRDHSGVHLRIERTEYGIRIWADQNVLEILYTVGNQEHDYYKVENPCIDLPRLRTWLDICDESHHGQCHHRPNWQSVDLVNDLLLIDTEKGCLVQCPGTTRYFALSYVWGHIQHSLETTMSNVDDLKQKGALYSKTSMLSIPQTIRDSMKLVPALNERYLWVDRFCIVQDHPAKHTVISRMDSIYANAYCTIIAADGNHADHGLRGVQLSRTSRQQIVDLPQCSFVTWTFYGSSSKYHTRGWTYQEFKLSARQLIFARDTVFWACQASFWEEEMCGQPKDSNHDSFFRLPYLSWPDLHEWEILCSNYNSRGLSFQEDAHVAFSGIERVIERAFPAGFLYGLPEFFFDLTLLWVPSAHLDRRVKPSADNGYYLPSWSWLGWQGWFGLFPWVGSTYSINLAMGSHAETVEGFRLEPLIDWVQLGPTKGQERRVQNDFHLWRARGEIKSSDPTGWISETTKQGTSYKNASIPGIAFRYPFPLAADMPPEDEQRTWPPYLRLRSHRALFTIRPCHFDRMSNIMALLMDKTARWAGVLFVYCDSQDALFAEPCELVAVSKGSANQLPEGGQTNT